MISRQLLNHLRKEHKVSPLSVHLKEIVYGGNDGIVTTFAVVAGFAGAQQMGSVPTVPIFVVLLFGLANLFADGTSMGLGNFLSIRSEKDVYKQEKAKELHEIRNNRHMEVEETIQILTSKGFAKEDAKEITRLYSKNEDYWAEFMMSDELELPNPEFENPIYTGLATFSAFVIFGFIPLMPYIFFQSGEPLFIMSMIFTFFALFLLGILRWMVTKVHFIRSVGEIVLIGGVSATFAYIVGTFFRI